jgi:hypothetical protein
MLYNLNILVNIVSMVRQPCHIDLNWYMWPQDIIMQPLHGSSRKLDAILFHLKKCRMNHIHIILCTVGRYSPPRLFIIISAHFFGSLLGTVLFQLLCPFDGLERAVSHNKHYIRCSLRMSEISKIPNKAR